MTELTTHIVERTTAALTSLQHAETEGDHHLVGVHTGELESLARVAHSHGLDVPELRPYAPAVA